MSLLPHNAIQAFKLVTLWHDMSLLHKNTIQAVPNRDVLITDGQKSTTKKNPGGMGLW